MKLNVAKRPSSFTHEGAPAKRTSHEAQLRRSVLSCLLWEREFYEDGQSIADRIVDLVGKVEPRVVVDLAEEARTKFHLRHVPLLLIAALADAPKRPGFVSGPYIEAAVDKAVQRADEIAELVAIWWRSGRRPLPAGMKRGLARAFCRFSAYQLAKYNRRDTAVRLRDVMFMVHPKPCGAHDAETFKALADDTLAPPDTWEVSLSRGADKKETFERLIREGSLGYLALLRNLRNMVEAGCDMGLVRAAIIARKGADRVLPFRYVAAARACPRLEPEIDVALQSAIAELPRLGGTTVVLVDVSGSMDHPLSAKSDIRRMDAAATLASVLNCEDLRVISFSGGVVEVPPRRGMAGVDAIIRSQSHGGTNLGGAVQTVNMTIQPDRLIVITDEQSQTPVPNPTAGRAYMVNVASYQNGVGYGSKWTHIDGFSENVIRFIVEAENAIEARRQEGGNDPEKRRGEH